MSWPPFSKLGCALMSALSDSDMLFHCEELSWNAVSPPKSAMARITLVTRRADAGKLHGIYFYALIGKISFMQNEDTLR